MTEKIYLDAQAFLEDCFRLGAAVFESGWRPSFILAVWRGGTPVGLAVQEFLAYAAIDAAHACIRTSAYRGIDTSVDVRVQALHELAGRLSRDDRLLIVDDVFDTGRTIEAIIRELTRALGNGMPGETRVAVPYYKPQRNQTARVPDFYLHETSAWIKYPHSLEGLGREEIAAHRPEIYEVIRDLLP